MSPDLMRALQGDGRSPGNTSRDVRPVPEVLGRRDLLVACGLFAGLCLIYQSIQRGTTPTYDASIYVDVAANIADHGSLAVRNDPFFVNTPYSIYGLGLSLLIIPFYLVQKSIQPGGQEAILLVNQLLIAGTAVLLYVVGCFMAASRTLSFVGAIGFGLLTMAPQQSTDLFSEPGVGFFTILSLLGLLIWRGGDTHGAWLLGLGLGSAIAFRADSVLLCFPLILLVPMFVGVRTLRSDVKWVYKLGTPLIVAATYQLWYNHLRYGSFLTTQYAGLNWSTPFWTGLYGNILSPGKGFFVYNAILLLALPGVVLLARRDRALAAAVVLLACARPIFYAKWQSWQGGVGWGPRFMFPLCAILVIPAIEGVKWITVGGRMRRVVGSGLASVGVLCGICLAALSVLVPFEQWFNVVNGNAGVVEPQEVIARRQHDYYWSFSGNHIAGNIRLLDDVTPTNLIWFREHREPWGPFLLLTGASTIAATGVLVRRLRHDQPITGIEAGSDGALERSSIAR